MKIVNGLKLYSHEEVKDKFLGQTGTPKRDEYELNLQMEVRRLIVRNKDRKKIFNRS